MIRLNEHNTTANRQLIDNHPTVGLAHNVIIDIQNTLEEHNPNLTIQDILHALRTIDSQENQSTQDAYSAAALAQIIVRRLHEHTRELIDSMSTEELITWVELTDDEEEREAIMGRIYTLAKDNGNHDDSFAGYPMTAENIAAAEEQAIEYLRDHT